MTATREAIVGRLQHLLEKGQTVLDSRDGESLEVDAGMSTGFQTQALVCLADVVGKEHPYYEEFTVTIEADPYSYPNSIRTEQQLGLLGSVLEDVEHGHMSGLINLVSAEVFDDFLDMAEHLLDNGYKDPAASLIGAVVEDGLRRIATNAGLTVASGDDLTALNNRCGAKAVYSRLVQKTVAVWIDVRNSADHGDFAAYAEADVRSMLEGAPLSRRATYVRERRSGHSRLHAAIEGPAQERALSPRSGAW